VHVNFIEAGDTMTESSLTTEAPDARAVSPQEGAGGGSKLAMRLRGLWKTYPRNNEPAVKDLSLDVHDGEIVTLLGPSGCGKTTTLRMAAGLEVPDESATILSRKAATCG
jgi:ABC-type glutathione transport system ATPase component